jgi:hypothetical protein
VQVVENVKIAMFGYGPAIDFDEKFQKTLALVLFRQFSEFSACSQVNFYALWKFSGLNST